jgi:hypothetical protein
MIGYVDLPPTKALLGATLVGVMIVVPPLAHRKQSQKPIVAGVIARNISLSPVNMCKGVDAERCMIQEHGAPEESDHES